jgi:hypothetical protein
MACVVNAELGGSGRRTTLACGMSILDGAARRTPPLAPPFPRSQAAACNVARNSCLSKGCL